MMTKILYIEDEPVTRIAFRIMVKSLPIQYFEAANCLDGIIYILDEKIDLVFLDLHMAGMDGYGFLDYIGGKEDFKYLNVVILSGESPKTFLEEALRRSTNIEQVVGYMEKPITIAKLQEFLQTTKVVATKF